MYKDKDKQREAVRLAVRRHRAKGITKVLHNEGVTATSGDANVIPAVTQAKIEIAKAAKSMPQPQSHDGRLRAAEGGRPLKGTLAPKAQG